MNKKKRQNRKKNPSLNLNSKKEFPLLIKKSPNINNTYIKQMDNTIYTKASCGEKILYSFPHLVHSIS